MIFILMVLNGVAIVWSSVGVGCWSDSCNYSAWQCLYGREAAIRSQSASDIAESLADRRTLIFHYYREFWAKLRDLSASPGSLGRLNKKA